MEIQKLKAYLVMTKRSADNIFPGLEMLSIMQWLANYPSEFEVLVYSGG